MFGGESKADVPRTNEGAGMSILAAYAVPHPPLIVPDVGHGQERDIQATIDAYHLVAQRVAAHRPDTIVVTSPHAPAFADGFYVSGGTAAFGDMATFNAPQATVEATHDQLLAEAIRRCAQAAGVPTAPCPPQDATLDHATFVPLWFVNERYTDYQLVRIGLSGLDAESHRMLGRAIRQAVEELDRRVVLIASGDLSHRLKEDGPYGFAPEGPEFDQACMDILAQGRLNGLFEFEAPLLAGAAECGLGSFQIMAGALAESTYEAEVLSYEGPFGVGYGVAAFEVMGNEDPYVSLARASVEHFVRTHTALPLPPNLPLDMAKRRAGVFVSLHEHGQLRGCIGTIAPTTESIASEIVRNGIAACSEDPRFPPVQPCELGLLEISVDVLAEPEPIDGPEGLDPKRYGVIVTQGHKRGLLLPNLEGVDTVDCQLAIAKQKAGIQPTDSDVELERFEVVRHG